MTNLEWIRIASKKDIAKLLCHGKECYACEAYSLCSDGYNGFLDWLEQESDNVVNTVNATPIANKSLYNGKVVCLDVHGENVKDYTVGKIYQFKDGMLTTDRGYILPYCPCPTFESWQKWSAAKWAEIW